MTCFLDIRDLSFSYTTQPVQPIFSKVSFSLCKGEVFCLLGPNGSGKSTLLKCIARVLRPGSGRVMLDHHDLAGQSPGKVARDIGFVPQSLVSAFPFTVADIVVMGRASRIPLASAPNAKDRAAADLAMARTGISHLSHRPCNRLSGGEWQMVLIARALTQSPRVMILDEPCSHLDLGNQVRILETIAGLARSGITILMASHFPDHAFLLAGKAGILKNGRLGSPGPPDQVLSGPALSRAFDTPVVVTRPVGGGSQKICIPRITPMPSFKEKEHAP